MSDSQRLVTKVSLEPCSGRIGRGVRSRRTRGHDLPSCNHGRPSTRSHHPSRLRVLRPHRCGRLADEQLRIILEADSYAWHGGLEAFDNDCSRYNDFTAHGWFVLRHTRRAVMYRPEATHAWIEHLTRLRLAATT